MSSPAVDERRADVAFHQSLRAASGRSTLVGSTPVRAPLGIDPLVVNLAAAHAHGSFPRGLVARLVAMSAAEQMSLADVKNRLSEVVDRLEREHGRVVITKHGRPAAVVLSIEDLEALEETLDVMSSRALLSDIREALDELDNGAAVLGKEEALRLVADR